MFTRGVNAGQTRKCRVADSMRVNRFAAVRVVSLMGGKYVMLRSDKLFDQPYSADAGQGCRILNMID